MGGSLCGADCMVCEKYIHYGLTAFVVAVAVSCVLSVNVLMSVVGGYRRCDGLVSLIAYVMLFYVFIRVVRAGDTGLFSSVFVIIGVISSVYGISQFFGYDLYSWSTDFGYKIRPASTFGHPAFFGAYLAMVMPLVMCGIVEKKGGLWRYYYISVLCLILPMLWLTRTRAAFVGAVVSAVYFFILVFGIKRCAVYMLAGLVFFGAANIADPYSFYNRTFREGDVTGGERVRMFRVGVDIMRDNPFFGVGSDCIGVLYPYYYQARYGSDHYYQNQDRLHCELMGIAAENGLVALSAWLFFLAAYFRMVWRNRDSVTVVALSAGVVAYLVQGFFSFGYVPIIVAFWFLIGMSIVLARENSGKKYRKNEGGKG